MASSRCLSIGLLLATSLISMIAMSGALSPNSVLEDWRRTRAMATAASLDASRYHLQILFVDDDNSRGRIAEGIFERVCSYNGAINTLFPFSATCTTKSTRSLREPTRETLSVSEALKLCPSRSTNAGARWSRSDFDDYDLIVPLDEEVRFALLASLDSPEEQEAYGPKCRTLSDFLSPLPTGGSGHAPHDGAGGVKVLLGMLDQDLRLRAAGYVNSRGGNRRHDDDDAEEEAGENEVEEGNAAAAGAVWSEVLRARPTTNAPALVMSPSGAAVLNPEPESWPAAEAALILAAAGLTRFCLDAMDESFGSAFDALLDVYIRSPEDLSMELDEVDEVMRRATISGYFSLEERKRRYEIHLAELAKRLHDEDKAMS